MINRKTCKVNAKMSKSKNVVLIRTMKEVVVGLADVRNYAKEVSVNQQKSSIVVMGVDDLLNADDTPSRYPSLPLSRLWFTGSFGSCQDGIR